MSKPAKKSARERLVAYYRMGVGCEDPRCGSCKHFAKLLRKHDREVIDTVLVGVAHGVPAHLIRAAILGPRAAKRGGR